LTVISPWAPTWERWRALRRTKGSLMRELMYERLRTLALESPLLDVGGGGTADYAQMLTVERTESVNIVTDLKPSVLADASRGLPFASGSFASVVSMNTMEHLLDDATAVRECLRVLRGGGQLHLMTPFLYRVHGHPDDYHRQTASTWSALVASSGIEINEVVIEPLVWDPMSTAWALVDTAPLGRNWWRLRRLLRPAVLARPLIFGRVDRRMSERADAVSSEYPLAFYVRVRRAR
jgi:SAM-dependent methyltransferase